MGRLAAMLLFLPSLYMKPVVYARPILPLCEHIQLRVEKTYQVKKVNSFNC